MRCPIPDKTSSSVRQRRATYRVRQVHLSIGGQYRDADGDRASGRASGREKEERESARTDSSGFVVFEVDDRILFKERIVCRTGTAAACFSGIHITANERDKAGRTEFARELVFPRERVWVDSTIPYESVFPSRGVNWPDSSRSRSRSGSRAERKGRERTGASL